MNSDPTTAAPTRHRFTSTTLLALFLAGCGGGDPIGLANPSAPREPPEIRPIGTMAQAKVRAAADRSGASAPSPSSPALDGGSEAAAGSVNVRERLPAEASATESVISSDPSPPVAHDTSNDTTPKDSEPDDGSEVTTLALDHVRTPQTDSTAARR